MHFVGNGVNITKERYKYLLEMESKVLNNENLYKEINSYDNNNKNNESNDEEVSSKNLNNKYKIKESYYEKDEDGNKLMSVTINSLSEIKERNKFLNTKANKVILLEFMYENLDLSEKLFISDSNFKVYDKEGNILESYPVDSEKVAKSISKGKKCTASAAYALNSKSKEIIVEFYSNILDNTPSAIFNLKLK
ncbi:hypothetical protein [Clostridium sp. Ade.TY]|uniref:hypothetical protein n=1 Tax=Clostridium sp. Ade.TY TaxID=1391647 RepID=UPI000409FABC|nr:hypothetical protein [Clostridium sp. Ade.TY]